MNKDNKISIDEIVEAIKIMVRIVYLDSCNLKKGYGLTGPQAGVVRSLAANGPQSSAAISRRFHVTPSNLTGVVDRLEQMGLVQRTRKIGDRRIALITLTARGAEVARTLPDPIEVKLAAGLGDLEPGRVRDLASAIRQILGIMQTDFEEDQRS